MIRNMMLALLIALVLVKRLPAPPKLEGQGNRYAPAPTRQAAPPQSVYDVVNMYGQLPAPARNPPPPDGAPARNQAVPGRAPARTQLRYVSMAPDARDRPPAPLPPSANTQNNSQYAAPTDAFEPASIYSSASSTAAAPKRQGHGDEFASTSAVLKNAAAQHTYGSVPRPPQATEAPMQQLPDTIRPGLPTTAAVKRGLNEQVRQGGPPTQAGDPPARPPLAAAAAKSQEAQTSSTAQRQVITAKEAAEEERLRREQAQRLAEEMQRRRSQQQQKQNEEQQKKQGQGRGPGREGQN